METDIRDALIAFTMPLLPSSSRHTLSITPTKVKYFFSKKVVDMHNTTRYNAGHQMGKQRKIVQNIVVRVEIGVLEKAHQFAASKGKSLSKVVRGLLARWLAGEIHE